MPLVHHFFSPLQKLKGLKWANKLREWLQAKRNQQGRDKNAILYTHMKILSLFAFMEAGTNINRFMYQEGILKPVMTCQEENYRPN